MIKFTRETLPFKFFECFKDYNDSTVKNMMLIIQNRGMERLSYPQIRRHFIVPKVWYRRIGVRTVWKGNEIYLTPDDELRVNVLQFHYFHRKGDCYMQERILKHLEYLSYDVCKCLVKYGDVPKGVCGEYSERRYREFGEI